MYFYAVCVGKIPGVYTTWEKAKAQIINVKGAKYKKFSSEKDAKAFVDNKPIEYKQKNITAFFKPLSDPEEGENTLIAFTDGSARNNGKKNALASFAVVWPFHEEFNTADKLGENDLHTNNRGEYYAVINALNIACLIDQSMKKTLIIYTDSQLLINSLTLWLLQWKKNNWKKSDGKIISNLDLVKSLDEKIKLRNVMFRHVRAHTGENTWEAHWNDIVDKLAQSKTLF
jgi:ribonuclease HI